jgi:hypothetical protein
LPPGVVAVSLVFCRANAMLRLELAKVLRRLLCENCGEALAKRRVRWRHGLPLLVVDYALS